MPAVQRDGLPQDRLIPLGSIQPFPGHGPTTLADVWRVGPLPGAGPIRVRAARLEDFAAIRALQRGAQPGLPPLTLKQLESRRLAFAEGQLVAESDGLVVGAASALVVRWDDFAASPTWHGITGDGFFTTHDRDGRTLFAAEVVADLTRRGFGAGRALHLALRRLCRRANLRRILVAARMPGYREARDEMPPDVYARHVIWGDLDDAWLRLQLSQGFQFCGILAGYAPEDAESCGHAALMVWLNPLYTPPTPGACAERERPRKCA